MRRNIALGLCLAGLTGGAARAQDPPSDAPMRVDRVDWQGPYFLLGVGVEGYTGKLAPNLDPGPSYGVLVGYRANDYLGVELGYSGGVSNLSVANGSFFGTPDIVRNGAQAALTVGFTHTRAQPYVLGGIGVERYSVREGNFFRFFDDTGGYAPVGAGVRYKFNPQLTAEVRGTYSFLFGQDFSPTQDLGAGDGRYAGMLMIGGSY
ncbi:MULTISPECIES: outer membrane beta-barrel protein [unclassified Corallococcus]|uniref:outer membrane beta-barrel protein n=1 Tax=unclassified Corallococcus TaxID=2685029 RepID=UPI001F5C7D93|nr:MULTISPECIES: outer membrane beta-barrel protein [unclassified Corallococcus]WAS88596.1 outer membrane beta-barrel protein [Corallococcus sp. NCRR]